MEREHKRMIIPRFTTPAAIIIIIISMMFYCGTLIAKGKKEVPQNMLKLYKEDYERLLMVIDKSVKLPLFEYNRLLDELRRAEEIRRREAERLKKLAGLSSARRYNFTGGQLLVEIEKNEGMTAKVDALMKIDLLSEGWKKIGISKLPGLERMLLNGKHASFNRESNPDSYSINAYGKGSTILKALYHPVIRRVKKGNRVYSSFRLELNQRCPFKVEIVLPKGAKPTSAFARTAKIEERRGILHAKVVTDFSTPLNVEWFVPRTDLGKKLESEFTAYVNSYFVIDEKAIICTAYVQLDFLGEIPAKVPLHLPEGYSLVDSELPPGVLLELSRTKTEGSLVLREDSENTIQFIVYAEAERKGNDFPLPLLTVEGAKRHVGYMVARADSMAIGLKNKGGLEPIDVRLAPAPLLAMDDREPDLAFKYSYSKEKPEYALITASSIQTADLVAAYAKKANYTVTLSEEGVMMTEGYVELINNSVQFLKVSLPERTTVLSAFVDEKGVKPVLSDDGQVMIPIHPKKHNDDGLIKVQFVYRGEVPEMKEDGNIRIDLPRLGLPVNLAVLNCYLPRGYEYEDFGGSMSSKKMKFVQPGTARKIAMEEKDLGSLRRSVEAISGKNGALELLIQAVDGGGQVLPGATATLTSLHAAPSRQLISGANGKAFFRNLITGPYGLVVTMDGFRSVGIRDLWIESGKKLKLIVPLELGEARETVGIVSTPPPSAFEYDYGMYFANWVYREDKVAGALPVKIQIPKDGVLLTFYDLLVVDEKPYVTFEYEEE